MAYNCRQPRLEGFGLPFLYVIGHILIERADSAAAEPALS